MRPPRHGWDAGLLAGAIGGGIAALIGLALVVGGLGIIAAHAFVRDDDGFYTSGSELLESRGYAVATEDIDLGNATDTAPDELLGRLRVTGHNAGDDPVFIGIARRGDVAGYLAGVAHSVLTDVDDPEYRQVSGRRPAAPPTAETFWAAEAQGPGEQVMEWDVEGGTWSVVLMNANGGRDVAVDAKVGIEIEWLIWVGVGLLLFGLVAIAGGVLVIVVMRRDAAGPPPVGR